MIFYKFGVEILGCLLLKKRRSGFRARGSDPAQTPQDVGDHTAGDPPVPIPNTEVKPRRADCTARESVWESRSLPALIKAIFRNECGLFLFPGFPQDFEKSVGWIFFPGVLRNG